MQNNNLDGVSALRKFSPQTTQRLKFLSCFGLDQVTESWSVQSLEVLLTNEKIHEVMEEMKKFNNKRYKDYNVFYNAQCLHELLEKNIKYLKDLEKTPNATEEHIKFFLNEVFPLFLKEGESMHVDDATGHHGITPQTLVLRILESADANASWLVELCQEYEERNQHVYYSGSSGDGSGRSLSLKKKPKMVFTERHLKQDYLMKVADKIYPHGRVKHMQRMVFNNEGPAQGGDLIIATVDEVVGNTPSPDGQGVSVQPLRQSEKDQALREVDTITNNLARFLNSQHTADGSSHNPLHYLEVGDSLLSTLSQDLHLPEVRQMEDLMIRLENLYGEEDWAKERLERRNRAQQQPLPPSPPLNTTAVPIAVGAVAGEKRGRKQGNSIASLTTPEQLRRSITLTEASLSKSNRVQVKKLNKLHKIVVHGNSGMQVYNGQPEEHDSMVPEDRMAAVHASKTKITELLAEVTMEMQKLVELTEDTAIERSAVGFRMTLHPGSNKRAYSEIIYDDDCEMGSGVAWNLEKAMELLGNAAPLTKRQQEMHEKLVSGQKVTKRMREAKYSIHTIE